MRYKVTIVMTEDRELEFFCTYPNDREWLSDLNSRIEWLRVGDYIVRRMEIQFIIIKEVNHESL